MGNRGHNTYFCLVGSSFLASTRRRFDAGDEKRGLITIVGQGYSTIDSTAKRVANRLNTKSEVSTPSRGSFWSSFSLVASPIASGSYTMSIEP